MAVYLAGGRVLWALLLLPFLHVAKVAAQESLAIQVVVRDDHRRQIEDVKPEEIQVSEDGKLVAVQSFRHVTPVNEPLLSILISSGSNESVSVARDNVQELLASAKNCQASVWDTKQGALLLDFQSDPKAVADALEKAAPDATSSMGAPKSKAVLATARQLIDEQSAEPWFAVLFALIAEQGKVAGRKEIVFFAAHGEEGAVTETQIAVLSSNALRAGVSVYIVETGRASAQAEARAAVVLTGHKQQAASAPDEWREVAQKTGGLYVTASKDNVRDVMRHAGEDLGSYYEATVQGTPQTEDGHFRPIVVKVARPRSSVQQAAGYFSVPKLCVFDLADYEIPMIGALHSGAESAPLAFDSQILRFRRQEGGTRVALIVEVPRGALYSLDDTEAKLRKVHFSIYAQIKSADGKVQDRFAEDVPYETAIGEHGAPPKNLFTFERSFLLPAGEYSAEVALQDQQASNLSHRSIPFSITASNLRVSLGDVVLVRGVEAQGVETESPLRFGSQSIIPWARPEIPFAQTAEMPVLLKIYTDPATEAPPDVQLEILHGKDQIANLPLLLSGGKGGEYQALVWLPESSLAPGHYTLVAHAEEAKDAAEQRREFDYVVGSSGASVEAESSLDVSPRQLLSPAPDLIAGIERPSEAEIASILQAARERALEFKHGLPNFSCLQLTKRFASKNGIQNWKPKDTVTELVHYNGGKEQHEILEVNGVTRAIDRTEIKGLLTKGEFGEFLDAVYSPDAQAEFKWQGLTLEDGNQVHVFAYKVKRVNSIYSLSTIDGRSRVNSAFHGMIHIDVKTLTTRFVSIEAEDIPEQSLYREAKVSVSYGHYTVGSQKYLLPKTAELSVRVGKRSLYRDDMEFRNYHRYGASSSFVGKSSKAKD